MADTRGIARWVRLSGEPNERRAFEYMDGILRGIGLRTQLSEHDASISLPGPARMEVVPVCEPLPCITHAFAGPTGPEGVTGEVVYVGERTPEEYMRADVRGKIALVEGLGIGGKVRGGEERGTIAQVFIHGEYMHETSVSPLWGAPTPETVHLLPKTPSFSVNRSAGARLKELLKRGLVRLCAWGEVATRWRKIPLLTGDLPGEVELDRFVLLSSHLDSWHYGAMDNGSANATLLEALRVLGARPRRRGLRVAFWSGHSHGRFAGSSWYADHHWFDLYHHCGAHVNSDSTGGRGATVLDGAPVMAELRDLAAEFIDKVDEALLVRDTQIYVGVIFRLVNEPILPMDYRATAREIRERLTFCHQAARGRLDLSAEIAAAAALEEQADRLAALVADDEVAADLRRARALNDTLVRLGRLLVPVGYTITGPFGQDLGMALLTLPGLAQAEVLGTLDPAADEGRVLYTALRHHANCIPFALEEAAPAIEAVL